MLQHRALPTYFQLVVTIKLILLGLTWGFAFFLSLGLRLWGFHHPDPFVIRPWIVFALLLVPSVVVGLWVVWDGFLSENGS